MTLEEQQIMEVYKQTIQTLQTRLKAAEMIIEDLQKITITNLLTRIDGLTSIAEKYALLIQNRVEEVCADKPHEWTKTLREDAENS